MGTFCNVERNVVKIATEKKVLKKVRFDETVKKRDFLEHNNLLNPFEEKKDKKCKKIIKTVAKQI